MDAILTIDISSMKTKVALISTTGLVLREVTIPFYIYDEGNNGVGKYIDTEEIWDSIILSLRQLMMTTKFDKNSIIGLTTCTRRMAYVFLNEKNETIYAGPGSDDRGINVEAQIKGIFGSDEELYNVTGKYPPWQFGISRLLWFKEFKPEEFKQIRKVLSLDDWLTYKFIGKFLTEYSLASDTQFLNVTDRSWSPKIIKSLGLDTDLFPPIVKAGTVVGNIDAELAWNLRLNKMPVIKSGTDTSMALLGMGCYQKGDMGIVLGSSASINLTVDSPIIDKNEQVWLNCSANEKFWNLEANAGQTGKLYDWFKSNILQGLGENLDILVGNYLETTEPGANDTFAYMGPQAMSSRFKNPDQKSAIIFPIQGTMKSKVTDRKNFTRAVIENIGFGILENIEILSSLSSEINQIYCAGGMSKSPAIMQLLANILNRSIKVPKIKDSSYIGMLILVMKAISESSSIEEGVGLFIEHDEYVPSGKLNGIYLEVYKKWKENKN